MKPQAPLLASCLSELVAACLRDAGLAQTFLLAVSSEAPVWAGAPWPSP